MKKSPTQHTFPIILLLILAITLSTQVARAQTAPWETPYEIKRDVPHIDGLTLAVDASARAHLVWSQGQSADSPTTALFYTGLVGKLLTQAVQIVSPPSGEMARQPDLLVDGQDRLHLAYSGGEFGEIFYTSANAAMAASASGWLPPMLLSYAPGAAWPQIGLAPDGSLVIIYVTQVNELRGVYWLRSSDGGRSWSDPAPIFDAAAAGWDAVGRPALAITPDGGVHVVFEQASLPGTWSTQGLFYTHGYISAEGLDFTPVEPVAPAGSSAPQLAASGGQVHLVYQGMMGLETRRLDLLEPEVGWRAIVFLAGWQYGVAGVTGFSLAGDAQNAHLLGPLPDSPGLRYSAWLSEVQVGWTNPPEHVEFRAPLLIPEPTPTPETTTEEQEAVEEPTPEPTIEPEPYIPSVMLASAARFNGGWLAAAWVSPGETGLWLHLSLRQVPEASQADLPPIPPTRTPTPTLTPTPAPPPGTPTPELNLPAPRPALPVDPLYLAGGLSAFVVLWVLGFYLIIKNRRK